MPAYSFKKQFAAAVKDGSKTQTIRKKRKKRPTVVGDKIILYTGTGEGTCRWTKCAYCTLKTEECTTREDCTMCCKDWTEKYCHSIEVCE